MRSPACWESRLADPVPFPHPLVPIVSTISNRLCRIWSFRRVNAAHDLPGFIFSAELPIDNVVEFMQRRHLAIALAVCLAGCAFLYARASKSQTITAEQARDHIGETATVCGRVASAHYSSKSRGRPTFLDFGRPYPHAVFAAVIWGDDRARFGQPEKQYRNKHVCVTGFISVFHGQPDMDVRDPDQINAR